MYRFLLELLIPFVHSRLSRSITVGCCVLLPVGLASSQVPSVPPPASTDPLASITTDTGDFAPGRITPSHYNTLQLCMAAVTNAGRLATRDLHAQTVAHELASAPLRDTVPTRAVAVAGECLDRFPVQRTTVSDLPDLVTLALLGRRDTTASAAVARWLTLAPSPARHDSVLLRAAALYLAAHPARATAAESLVTHVSQTGVAGDRVRLAAARMMLRFWGDDVFDHQHMQHWANEVIHIANAMPGQPAGETKYEVLDAYGALMRVAYLQSPDSTRAIATREIANRALEDIRRFKHDTIVRLSFDPATVSAETVAEILMPVPAARGEIYPTLQADYWFPVQVQTHDQTHDYAHDRSPTLFISTQADWGWGTNTFAGAKCLSSELELLYTAGDACTPLYERIRSLGAKYGSKLTIVLIAGTQGNAIRSLPLSPRQEAERLKWYVLDYLKLPVTLAVVERRPFQLPQPDGRHFARHVCSGRFSVSVLNDSSAAACQYLAIPMILLGRRGELVAVGRLDPTFDTILEQTVNSAPAPSGATAAGSRDE